MMEVDLVCVEGYGVVGVQSQDALVVAAKEGKMVENQQAGDKGPVGRLGGEEVEPRDGEEDRELGRGVFADVDGDLGKD